MKLSKNIPVFICVFFALCHYAIGQNKAKPQPFLEVLTILETRYNVSFSYLVDDVAKLNAVLPLDFDMGSGQSEKITLDLVLTTLEQQLPVIFIKLENSIAIQKKSPLDFTNQYLDEVLIKQYLARGITLNNNGSITIKPRDFEVIPGLSEPDVLASVKSLPGMSSTDESVTNLNIRGGTNDQNLILWDGIKMYQSGHFFGMISAFDPYSIDKIHVTKNGSSAKTGDGVSGTIEMVLGQNPKDSFEGSAGFNLLQGSAFLKSPLFKNVGIQLSARRSITDAFETPTYMQYYNRVFQDTEVIHSFTDADRAVINNQQFYFYDISSKLMFNISEENYVSASFITINNEFNFLEQATNTDINEALESGLKQQNNAGNFTYIRKWNTNFDTQVSGYLSNYKLSGINYDIVNNQRLDQFNEVVDLGLKLDGTYTLSGSKKLFVGYHFNETGVTNAVHLNTPPVFNFIKEVLISHAGYAEINQTSQNINIAAGLRVTNYPKLSETFIEPRVNASWKFFKNFRLHLSGELKHQATSQIIQQSDDFLGVVKRRWVIANNDDVDVVQSRQFSLGSAYNFNKWLVSVEGYYKNVAGINSRSQGFRNQFQFTNTNGEYTINGIDFLIQKRYKSLRSWLGYSLSENTFTFEELNNGGAFPNSVDMRHSVTFNNSYTFKKLSAAIGFSWHTGIPTTSTLISNSSAPSLEQLSARELQYNAPNGERLENFFRTDIALNYSLNVSKKLKGTIGVSVWNVFNQQQTIDRYYANVNDEAVLFEQQSLGFTPNLSVRLFF